MKLVEELWGRALVAADDGPHLADHRAQRLGAARRVAAEVESDLLDLPDHRIVAVLLPDFFEQTVEDLAQGTAVLQLPLLVAQVVVELSQARLDVQPAPA
jgi:hypothetical protein